MARSKSSQRPWRKIIRRDTIWSEKASLSHTSFSWSATYAHTLTLECGHTQKRRGYTDPPKHEVVCKDCEAGKPQVSVEGIEHGIFDKTKKTSPKGAKIVDALIHNERERMKTGRVCTCDKTDDEGMTQCQFCTDMEAQEAARVG